MGDKSAISWTNSTWNPIVGCRIKSPGCVLCYAAQLAGTRLNYPGSVYEGLTHKVFGRHIFTGEIRFLEQRLAQPLHWTKPRMIFTNSMSDMFYEDLTDEQLDLMFDVMEKASWHIFQVLTKRPERAREYLAKRWSDRPHPPAHIWIGTSVERQREADIRIPHLMETPAAVRFLSCEPLLGWIDLSPWLYQDGWPISNPGLHWVIAGGESGGGFRPMDKRWAIALRDQCAGAAVPFFFKQDSGNRPGQRVELLGRVYHEYPVTDHPAMRREEVTA